MDDNPLFDLPSASALARLRIFLDDARARAHDLSEPGRHLALVSLDGAVEYALWLVAHTIGVQTKGDRTGFADLIKGITERIEGAELRWSPRGRAGVDQLRRARNDAQHAAVIPDPSQLAFWSDAAHAYVDLEIQALQRWTGAGECGPCALVLG